MPEKDLNDRFLDTLKDLYYAEKQIYKALPKMAMAPTNPIINVISLPWTTAAPLGQWLHKSGPCSA
ncbi:hypothetical protein J2W51_001953 [Tardiphaga robiniae]|nr:hypothetical protein [Tardiphaga robiniae]